MKFGFLVSTFLLFSFGSKAQQENKPSIQNVFLKKSQWEIGLSHGFVRPEISPVFGPYKAYAINGRVFDLGLGYTFNASDKVGFTATGKVGAYPFMLGIPTTAYSPGSESNTYFMDASYTPFAEVSGTAAYRHFLSNRFALLSGVGLGAKFVASTWVRAGYGSYGNSTGSTFVLENTGEAKPFLMLQSGLQYKLRNSDLVVLKFSYQYSLKTIQEGTYSIAPNSPEYSYGTVKVKGSQLSVGLTYVFTGYEKMLRRMASETPANKKELKRTLKREYFEKRLGKSSAIRVFGAVFADQNTSTDKAEIIGSYRPVSLGYGLDFYREFKPNYFWEAGFSSHEYWQGIKINYSGFFGGGSASNAFESKQISVGGGYILRNNNKVPLFYFSGGAGLGFANSRLGLVGRSVDSISSPSTGQFVAANSNNYQLHKTIPLLYVGISKDFRIRGKLFFSPAFRYYQGLTKVYEGQMNYSTDQLFPESRNTTVFMRGSYFQYSIGLKLDL